ncbi:MAG: hypothetical protein AAGB48_05995 [Planctomycetota bacterium]
MALSAGSAAGQFVYDESIDGDLSDDRTMPDVLIAAEGSNTIRGTVIADDLEYFRFEVPVGLELAAINVLEYTSLDPLAFLAVQTGTEFTVDPLNPDPGPLLGYVLYGPPEEGTNVLDDMGASFGSIGFSGSLPAGDYVFWNQQTGIDLTTYELEFVLVPGPAGVGVLALAGLAAARRRR